MSDTPFARTTDLSIGIVDSVSPADITVAVDIDSPDSIALNSGTPRPFPRVHGYLLVSIDDGSIVGQIESIVTERTAFPKRRGLQDFGLVDLPYPHRRLKLNPLGTLRRKGTSKFAFRRGAAALPTVGASVAVPTDSQLRAIVESSRHRRVTIGTSPLASDADVSLDPDRLFGRHLAVLGNTGSGKSCSVAGLIRWSLLNAKAGHVARQRADESEVQAETRDPDPVDPKQPNARFIVLDPNGEYSRAFSDDGNGINARVFRVDPRVGEIPLQVPIWLWNSAEWFSFAQASVKTQQPTLLHALRLARDGHIEPAEDADHEIRSFLRTLVSTIRIEKNSGSPWGQYPKPRSFFEKIEKWRTTLHKELNSFDGERHSVLSDFVDELERLCAPRRRPHPQYDFELGEIRTLLKLASRAHAAFGGKVTDETPPDVDAPRPFRGESLLRNVEAVAEMLNVSEHVETLLLRMRAVLQDARMVPILADGSDIALDQWLTDYIGADQAKDGCVSVIDLSLVPSNVVHIVTTVIARIVFEALQRHVKLFNTVLPTVLVMEEAHTFIKRYADDVENVDAATVCCQTFERIAREGRKFGLGLVLSSQRPAELSATVLSQCNSFLLHRINNDRDQAIVRRLVPDNLSGLMDELPSLPTQTAIVLGWATELPILVRMNDLPKWQQPRSDDPDFWSVWTGRVDRKSDWPAVAKDWQDRSVERPVDGSASRSEEQSVDDQEILEVGEPADDLPF